uniref:RING-type domain-containing protein n=1 Tax=Parastrongyloides trichosuri TaxID=131310 RepID=A0A0N5A2Y0_PARTI
MEKKIPSMYNCQLICFKDFDKDQLTVNVKCGHTFHKECIYKWITNNHRCPKCRVPSSKKDIIKIYCDETINESFTKLCKENFEKISINNLITFEGNSSDNENQLNEKNREIMLLKEQLADSTKNATVYKMEELYQRKIIKLSDDVTQERNNRKMFTKNFKNLELLYNNSMDENRLLQQKYVSNEIMIQMARELMRDQKKELENRIKENIGLRKDLDKISEVIVQISKKYENNIKTFKDLYEKRIDILQIRSKPCSFMITSKTINGVTQYHYNGKEFDSYEKTFEYIKSQNPNISLQKPNAIQSKSSSLSGNNSHDCITNVTNNNNEAAYFEEMKKKFLQQTNEYRKMHDVVEVVVDPEIVAKSQAYAEYLAANNIFKHDPDNKNYGENLGMGFGGLEHNVVKMWYDEIIHYDFENPTFSPGTGHFTQLVWKKSNKVGFGIAKAKNGYVYVVCKYYPKGNWMGEFKENVPEPLKR